MAAREIFESRLGAGALLLPTMVVSVVFLYYPAVRALLLSFHEASFGRGNVFVGLDNYVRLFRSGDYLDSAALTVAFAALVVVLVMGLALAVTFLIHEVEVGTSVYLVSAIWPYALPPAVAGLVFLFLVHPTLGVVTTYVEALGVEVDWFSDGPQAFAVVLVAAVWKQIGYNVIFMTAAMNNVPASLTETARLDGVSRLQRLFRVYVPMMSPTLVFLAVINTIYGFFGTFPFVDLMTKGGPAGATNVLIYDLYRTAFQFYDFGFASAKSVVLFVVVGLLMYVQFRVSDRYTHYG
ncbi:carbohydrate ABC transporter permease [Natronomonas sp. EA1]|uniref:carbohydrate ABC transporter permease n=1 Tax=Natronomonas sp. EA1 TaxID=3421655 RepID=UPI003EBEB022